MEPRFEVRYTSSHKMLAEFARKYSVGPRPVMVCIAVAIYLYFIFNSWWNDILLEMLPTLLMMGIVFGTLYFIPDYYAWATRRSAKKQNDNVLPEIVITFGDTIEMHEGMVNITLEYRKIQKAVRLKHSYVLMNGKRTGLMFRDDCFTKGTFEEFKQFLHEKCPDLIIPA